MIVLSNPTQHLILPSLPSPQLEQFYAGSSTAPHLSTENSSSPSILTIINPNSIRPPPPRYQSPTANIERSKSTFLSTNDSPTSSQQSKPIGVPPPPNNAPLGFDREFSRLLYGKESGRARRQKQKRKALSDPVK